jgi:hypothetical protein
VYFLHDFKIKDQSGWPKIERLSFAFTAWANLAEDRLAALQGAPRNYARVKMILCKYKPWQAYDEGSEADKELREAGATYASLLSLVWESTLGQPDHGVLGVYPSSKPHE